VKNLWTTWRKSLKEMNYLWQPESGASVSGSALNISGGTHAGKSFRWSKGWCNRVLFKPLPANEKTRRDTPGFQSQQKS
jgi:hypothetical protein